MTIWLILNDNLEYFGRVAEGTNPPQTLGPKDGNIYLRIIISHPLRGLVLYRDVNTDDE